MRFSRWKTRTASLIAVSFLLLNESAFAMNNDKIHNIESLDYNENNDLEFMKEKLENVEIVGIGEATHFTKEFFEFRHKLLKFLVEEMGYRAFVMEAPDSIMYYLNKYVQTGEGNLEEMFYNTYWLLESREFYNTIEWMKNYNLKQTDENKIRLYGMDINKHNITEYMIVDYVKTVDLASGEALEKKLPSVYNTVLTLNQSNEIYNGTIKVLDNKEACISKSSEAEYEMIKNITEGLKRNEEYMKKKNLPSFTMTIRDEAMANTVTWIQNHEKKYFNNSKMLISAHNGHITKLFQEKVLGSFLEDIYKEKYYSIGVDFYNGSFIAENNKTGISKAIINNSNENNFSSKMKAFGNKMAFIDIDEAMLDEELRKVINEEKGMYIWGAGFSTDDPFKNNQYDFDIEKSFDGIFYVENTNAATPFETIRMGNDYILDGENKGPQETGGNIDFSEIEKSKNSEKFYTVVLVIAGAVVIFVIKKIINRKSGK